MAVLAIDVGNHRIKLTLVSDLNRFISRQVILTETLDDGIENIIKTAAHPENQGVVIGSTIPGVSSRLVDALSNFDPLVVTGETNSQLKVNYSPLSSLGADRLSAAVGAYVEYGKTQNRAIMIVDAGTAVTADLVNIEGEFLGGAIFPGEKISLESLTNFTAQLPKTEFEVASNYIGNTTRDSMLVGIKGIILGGIEYIYKKYAEKRGERPFLVISGGSAPWISGEITIPHIVDPDITLIGLAAIWSLNREN